MIEDIVNKEKVELCEHKRIELATKQKEMLGYIFCYTCEGKNYLCEHYIPAIKYED